MLDIHDRIERWYCHAKQWGIPLTRILIHPDDAHRAPKFFEGLPVEPMTRGSI